jgi:hypothetical protein
VQPARDHRPQAGDRLHLCDLGLVVREDQVDRAAMQVVLRAQQALADRRVLDVPSGPSVAELRRPERLTGLARLPEDEVARVALVGLASSRETGSPRRTFVRPESRP